MQEDWDLVKSFLPGNWRELAADTGALKRLRGIKSVENLLRVLLMHLGCGYSLRETAVRARQVGLAELSDVALMKRLRNAGGWLQALCVELFREQGLSRAAEGGFQIRAMDATTVREPGKTGSLWRIHYSVRLPSLSCDFFRVTATEGKGSGESLTHFPIQSGDHVVADRGYARAPGLVHVAHSGGYATVRVNTRALALQSAVGEPLDLLETVRSLRRADQIGFWPARVVAADGGTVAGRICAVRKSREAIRQAQKKIRSDASRKGTEIQPKTVEFAKFVIVFTNFPEADFSARQVLEWYRTRWQVELVFKRLKSLAELGHLPKYDDDSARAWLYGKLLVALLVEKLIRHAESVSPWGYELAAETDTQRVA